MKSPNNTPLTDEAAYELAWNRLQHVLSFFDRVDTKQSVVLGINVALIGVLVTQVLAVRDIPIVGWALIGAYLPLSVLSFVHLYRGSFPQLHGGEGSLIYFAQIASLTREQFASRFLEQSSQARLDDVLEQVRHNACIATAKYRHLRWAYRSMALSIIPWAVSIAIFTMRAEALKGATTC